MKVLLPDVLAQAWVWIQIIGEANPERVEVARQADHIYASMIRQDQAN